MGKMKKKIKKSSTVNVDNFFLFMLDKYHGL